MEGQDEARERAGSEARSRHRTERGAEPERPIALDAPEPVAEERGEEPQEEEDGAAAYRGAVTPTRRQRSATGQEEQRGPIGRQTFWPKATRRALNSIQ